MAITTKTQALKKLYKAIIGEDTTKNDPTKIICDLADNWSGGGGGGSSDFSTATVQYESNAIELAYIPRIDENLGIVPVVAEDGIYNVPLYNGKAFGIAPSDAQPSSIVVDGSIVYDDGVFIITGNGSITINDK